MKLRAFYLGAFIWAAVSIISVSLLHTLHSFDPAPQGRWVLTHILDPHHGDSERIQTYLLKRNAVKVFDELVILLEPHGALQKMLKKRGYVVAPFNRQPLQEKLPDLKAPYFLITSPRGEGVYAGTYGENNQDLEIAESFFSQKTLSKFPISGCGNSVRVQKFFDPQAIILAQKNGP